MGFLLLGVEYFSCFPNETIPFLGYISACATEYTGHGVVFPNMFVEELKQ
jgi:hypothetical protein